MKKTIKIVAMILSAVMAFGSVSGCGKQQKEDENGVVTLKWYLPGVMDGADCQEVLEYANQKLEEKYNMRVDFSFIDGGNFTEKLNAINAAGQEYDLVFTSNWANDFHKNVTNGCLLDISELLPQYAPTLYKNTDENVWKALTFDGKIYSVPNWQEQAKGCGLIIDKSKLDKAGMTIDDLNTMDDLTTYVKKVHAVEPNTNHIGVDWEFMAYKYGIQGIGVGSVAVDYTKEGKPVLFNTYDSEGYEDYVKLVDSWEKEGLIRNYIDTEANASKKEVRTNLFQIAGYAPENDVAMSISRGYDCVTKLFSDKAVMSTSGIYAALTGVSATTKHAEEAVKMLEIINTDKEIFNTLLWGIEGKHYTKIDNDHIKLTEGSAYNNIADFYLGSAANSYVMEGQSADVWDKIKKYNDDAVVSPILGCNFVTDNIQSELSNCQTIISKETTELNRGLCDDVDAALKNFREQLKAAGIDRVVAELQSQVDEWWEANK